MSTTHLEPGCYTLPLGCDVLWWLSDYVSKCPPQESLMIVPTDRAAKRLSYLMQRHQGPSTLAIKSYAQLAATDNGDHPMRHIVWQMMQDPAFCEHIFSNQTPSLEHKLSVLPMLQQTLELLLNYEITPDKLADITSETQTIQVLQHLLLRYDNVRGGLQHPTVGFNAFCQTIPSHTQRIYMIIDGPILPALERVVVQLSQNHVVLISGRMPGHRMPLFHPSTVYGDMLLSLNNAGVHVTALEGYTHRKALINALEQTSFLPVNQRYFDALQMKEHPNLIAMAHDIVHTAADHVVRQKERVTLVTSNRSLAALVGEFARQAQLPYDDSYGIPLDQTTVGYLLMQLMVWCSDHGANQAILNLLLHPALTQQWGSLGVNLDTFGRTQCISIQRALNQYVPADDQELSALQVMNTFINTATEMSPKDAIPFMCHTLSEWGIATRHPQEFEYVCQCLSGVVDFDTALFVLRTQTYRILSPLGASLMIVGPLEVRLLNPKVVMIAEMNEGEWPTSGRSNLWLNGNIRQELNLPPSQQMVAFTSKILLALLASKSVYLYRTTHQNNQPQISSRWWERLRLLAHRSECDVISPGPHAGEHPFNGVTNMILPREHRPKRLSISDVHRWINEPSSFVLETLLGLGKLLPWDATIDHRDKGILVHQSLQDAIDHHLNHDQLIQRTLERLDALDLPKHDQLFWKAQIQTYVQHFFQLHQGTSSQRSYTEVKGEWTLETEFGPVTIVGKADRIDMLPDGQLHIIDYKTGTCPSKKTVYDGLAPQLVLLGLMAHHGAFKELPSQSPMAVSYWNLKEGESHTFIWDDVRPATDFIMGKITEILDPKTVFSLT